MEQFFEFKPKVTLSLVRFSEKWSILGTNRDVTLLRFKWSLKIVWNYPVELPTTSTRSQFINRRFLSNISILKTKFHYNFLLNKITSPYVLYTVNYYMLYLCQAQPAYRRSESHCASFTELNIFQSLHCKASLL